MIGTTTAAVIMRNCVPACGACKVGRLRDSRSEVFNGDPKEIQRSDAKSDITIITVKTKCIGQLDVCFTITRFNV